MRHPTEGVLRRLLDEPVGVADADRAHVAGCERCLATLATARVDAAFVGAALAVDTEVDVDAAWRRMPAGPARVTPLPARRRRPSLRHPAVAAVAVAVVFAGAGTAAANRWLPIFRTEKVVPLAFSPDDLVSLPDLSKFGDVEVTQRADVREVADAAAAAAATGLDVPEVTALPRGVTGAPSYRAGGEMSFTFTFDADRAERSAREFGEPLAPVPPGLDGSSVRLVAGPGVALLWTQAAGVPSLVVGRAVAPKAYSSGVPFETLRDYLLSLPWLPEEVATKLRTFAADGSTLPLPVPSDRFTTSSAEVGGHPATVLAARDRTMSAVVWVQDGVLTAVAGAVDTGEVLSVARGLR